MKIAIAGAGAINFEIISDWFIEVMYLCIGKCQMDLNIV